MIRKTVGLFILLVTICSGDDVLRKTRDTAESSSDTDSNSASAPAVDDVVVPEAKESENEGKVNAGTETVAEAVQEANQPEMPEKTESVNTDNKDTGNDKVAETSSMYRYDNALEKLQRLMSSRNGMEYRRDPERTSGSGSDEGSSDSYEDDLRVPRRRKTTRKHSRPKYSSRRRTSTTNFKKNPKISLFSSSFPIFNTDADYAGVENSRYRPTHKSQTTRRKYSTSSHTDSGERERDRRKTVETVLSQLVRKHQADSSNKDDNVESPSSSPVWQTTKEPEHERTLPMKNRDGSIYLQELPPKCPPMQDILKSGFEIYNFLQRASKESHLKPLEGPLFGSMDLEDLVMCIAKIVRDIAALTQSKSGARTSKPIIPYGNQFQQTDPAVANRLAGLLQLLNPSRSVSRPKSDLDDKLRRLQTLIQSNSGPRKGYDLSDDTAVEMRLKPENGRDYEQSPVLWRVPKPTRPRNSYSGPSRIAKNRDDIPDDYTLSSRN